MASSLETNKLIAAVLTAGVIASGAGVMSRILYHAEEPEETAYVIAVADEGAGGEGGGDGGQPLGVLLASADASAGEGGSRACAACHSFEEGGANKIGPALHGVVGREIAAVDGFAYSDALAGKEEAWDYAALDGFLADPKGWAPGTKMSYAGIKSDEDRADMILYLRSISPDAPPLPEPEETETAEGGSEGGEEAGGSAVIAMLGEVDPAAGETAAKKCAACHSFDEGGANKIGPALHGVVGRQFASVDGFAYSDALAGMDGAWDYAALDGFLADPKGWAPGTKMSFAGVQKEQERAELIAYLRSISPDAPPLPEGGGQAEDEGSGDEQQQAGDEQSAEQQQAAADGSGEDTGQDEASGGEQEAAAEDASQSEGEGQAPSGDQQQAEAQSGGEEQVASDQQEQQAAEQEGASESGEQQQAAAGDEQSGSDDQAAADQQQSGESGSGEQQEAAATEEPSVEGSSEQSGGAAAEGAVAMIASADPAAGEKAARKCVACHSFDEGGPDKIGPNLHGVVGRDIASVDGFNYSGALKDKAGSWDYASLDAFIADPRGWAKGTRMSFAGVKKEQERAEVLAYLKSVSPDAPPPPGQ